MKPAVIGAEYWSINLVRVFRQLDVLDRICDFSVPRLDKFQKLYPDLRLGSSIDQVLEDSSVDGVVIATPAESHYSIARCPKMDGADAWRMLKVLEASQRSLSMNGRPVQLQPNRSLEAANA